MTTYNLEELSTICSLASAAPWPESYERANGQAHAKGPIITDHHTSLEPVVINDAKFIAAARVMLPKLLAIATLTHKLDELGAIKPKGHQQDQAALELMGLIEEITFVREVPDAG